MTTVILGVFGLAWLFGCEGVFCDNGCAVSVDGGAIGEEIVCRNVRGGFDLQADVVDGSIGLAADSPGDKLKPDSDRLAREWGDISDAAGVKRVVKTAPNSAHAVNLDICSDNAVGVEQRHREDAVVDGWTIEILRVAKHRSHGICRNRNDLIS